MEINAENIKRVCREMNAAGISTDDIDTIFGCMIQQIPEEPVVEEDYTVCPVCKEVVEGAFLFCGVCGKALLTRRR